MAGLIFGNSVPNHTAPARQKVPVSMTVYGAPMCWASPPARRLPKGAAPKKAMV